MNDSPVIKVAEEPEIKGPTPVEAVAISRLTDTICEVLKRKMSTGQIKMMRPDFEAVLFKVVRASTLPSA